MRSAVQQAAAVAALYDRRADRLHQEYLERLEKLRRQQEQEIAWHTSAIRALAKETDVIAPGIVQHDYWIDDDDIVDGDDIPF